MRIIFSGMLAGVPHNGGATWAVLQYLLGFRRLGHDVLFVEPVDALTPENVSYFEAVVSAYGLEGNASLLESGGSDSAGVPYSRLREWARAALLARNPGSILASAEGVTATISTTRDGMMFTSTSTPSSTSFGTPRESTLASQATRSS